MPDIRFVPVYGGYAVHTGGCPDIPTRPRHTYGTPRQLEFVKNTLTDAVAEMYRKAPISHLMPERFFVYGCARHLPLAATRAPWDANHDMLTGQAAHFLWVCSRGAVARAQEKTTELRQDIRELERPEQWRPEPGMLREQIAARHAMELWDTVRADETEEPQPTDTETCRRWVLRAEAALSDATERLMLEEGNWPDPVEHGIADAERTGARQFVKAARNVLAKVHAHRALRDGCVRADR